MRDDYFLCWRQWRVPMSMCLTPLGGNENDFVIMRPTSNDSSSSVMPAPEYKVYLIIDMIKKKKTLLYSVLEMEKLETFEENKTQNTDF